MRWGRLLVVLVVVALVGGLALWLRDRPEAASDQPGAAETPTVARSRPLGLGAGPAMPWLWQNGLDARRIAGRVVHAGRPVAKAVVRLTTEELHIGEWAVAELETDQEGRFDFGPRPASRYMVVAQAEGLVAGGVGLELRARDVRPAPDDVTIELRDCELVISGTVRDAAGGIIAGARVRAATRSEVFGGVLSDEQGNYRVCLLAGQAHIEAGADGYGTAFEHARGRRAARVDFALSPEIAIAGRVVGPAGEPVGRAVVIAETNGHDPGALTESAADGGFRVEGLVAGTYRVVARDGDLAAEKTVTLTAAGAPAELLLTLEPRATLTGRVVVGDRPAGDATVLVGSAGEEWTLGTAVTDRAGRFAVAGLPRGPVQLLVEKHELLSPDETIDLSEVRQVELVCERRATVRGRVTRAGEPAARAEVHLYQEHERRHAVMSEEDGTFEMEGVKAASYDIFATSLAKGASMARRPIAVGAQDIADLVLDLDLTASIAGAVVDPSGAPVGGVMVGFSRGDDEAFYSDATADDGNFLVTGLAAGSYRPFVMRDDHRPLRPAEGLDFPSVEIAGASSRVTGVQLAIARADLTISGRTVRRGQGVAGIDIDAFSVAGADGARTRSGADGTFVLDGLAAGPYELRTERAGGGVARAAAGATDVLIELPASGRIEGVLRGFRTRPEVHVRGPNGGWGADVADMRFSIPEVAVGAYDVTATTPDGAHASAQVTVTADQVSRLTLTASLTATLSGVVKDLRTGAPMPGIHCYWRIGASHSMQSDETDATGGFSFGVPAGTVELGCMGGQTNVVLARQVVVTVEPGATAHVVVDVVALSRPMDGMVGVELDELPPGSLRVRSVISGAASSGLRAGDILIAVDGLPVAGLLSHVAYLLMIDREIGAKAVLTVERQGAELTFEVPVEPVPAPPEGG